MVPSSPARLEGIYLTATPGAPTLAHRSVRALPGQGLEGDRHARAAGGSGWPREVTLIAGETLDALARENGLTLAPGASRRQLVTRGVALDGLVGRRLRVGRVLLEATKPCRPCDHLESLTLPGVRAALEGRGGVCARILEGGTLTVGDPVVVEPAGS